LQQQQQQMQYKELTNTNALPRFINISIDGRKCFQNASVPKTS
jgi:hypothetical protein